MSVVVSVAASSQKDIALGDLIWHMRHQMYRCTGCGTLGTLHENCPTTEFWHRKAQEDRTSRYIESLNIPPREVKEMGL